MWHQWSRCVDQSNARRINHRTNARTKNKKNNKGRGTENEQPKEEKEEEKEYEKEKAKAKENEQENEKKKKEKETSGRFNGCNMHLEMASRSGVIGEFLEACRVLFLGSRRASAAAAVGFARPNTHISNDTRAHKMIDSIAIWLSYC